MSNVFDISDYKPKKKGSDETYVPEYNPVNVSILCEKLVELGWSYLRDPKVEENNAIIDFKNKIIKENCPASCML